MLTDRAGCLCLEKNGDVARYPAELAHEFVLILLSNGLVQRSEMERSRARLMRFFSSD